jgi:hypothetical protein
MSYAVVHKRYLNRREKYVFQGNNFTVDCYILTFFVNENLLEKNIGVIPSEYVQYTSMRQ